MHLGNFFIFDKTKDGNYQLIEEKGWKVEDSKLNNPFVISGKKIFETVERTGGTGLDIYISHLWYLEDGKMIEAWQGILKELNAMRIGEYSLTVGGHQLVFHSNILYCWESKCKLDDDAETVLSEPITSVKNFTFDGRIFIEK